MSATKDWYMSIQPELDRYEAARIRQIEEDKWMELREREEIEILNSELVEESFLLAGSCSPDCSVVATLLSGSSNSIELGQSVITNQNQSL